MQQPPLSSTGEATEQLRSDAQQLTTKATDRIHREVDARKDTAVTQARSTATAIQSAAGQLDQGAPQWLRSALQQGAEQIQRFADGIESRDSRQLLEDVQSFARERPGIFLGVAAAAGFAAARVLKAGAPEQSAERFEQAYGMQEWDRSEPWGSGEQASPGQGTTSKHRGRSGTPGEQFDEGLPSSQRQPFMASRDTGDMGPGSSGGSNMSMGNQQDSPQSAKQRQTSGTSTSLGSEQDPLVLGTGGQAGRRIPERGDMA